MSLTPKQVERYARHLVLKEIGGPGQQQLLQASVLIIGAGGLGAPVALYLAAAGVGTIGLLDHDHVSLANLQRQILFDTSDVGYTKTAMAARRLSALNPDPNVIALQQKLTAKNAIELLEPYDLIIDGTDNFPTRFLVNQSCHALGKTLISGAVGRFDGQVSVHQSTPKTACYQCLVPSAPPDAMSCEQVGIVGALTGIIGSIMALEAIKLISGTGDSLAGRLLIWDGLSATARTVDLPADPACPVCGVK
ncbi:Molybdopterin-synthase adenylyltransferase [hydrothermal vent metagenome]|uniref:Molybdopterin-synthase adenylyltransferase n=1 Tax=hydrothermal vent metagenome TaxID=652676 RepID=A0A3B0RRJ4_9ZZZZ